MPTRDDYGFVSDAQGYAIWGLAAICYTSPIWLPIACLVAGFLSGSV